MIKSYYWLLGLGAILFFIGRNKNVIFDSKVMSLLSVFPGRITSVWRSVQHNKDVGGAASSLHLVGLAADIILDNRADAEPFMIMARRLNLWVLDEGDHIHIQEASV